MRISDWSSDVCSSDLSASTLPAAPFEPAREIAQQSRVQPGTGEGIENGALPSDMSPLRLGEGMCQRRNLALVVQNEVVRERLQDRAQVLRPSALHRMPSGKLRKGAIGSAAWRE